MLTVERLEAMEPGTVFHQGELPDTPLGLHLTGSGKMLRFVAVRGDIPDWAIYAHWADGDWDYIRRFGDKLHSEEMIRRVVPCTDEAFGAYRP